MKRLFLTLLIGAALAASSPAHAAVKTIVLVHGAFADGSGWKPVADILQSHGYSVLVVQEPETSFAADVAATRRVLDKPAISAPAPPGSPVQCATALSISTSPYQLLQDNSIARRHAAMTSHPVLLWARATYVGMRKLR